MEIIIDGYDPDTEIQEDRKVRISTCYSNDDDLEIEIGSEKRWVDRKELLKVLTIFK